MNTTLKPFLELTDSSFEGDVLQTPGPVLVDFWAPWCSTCRAMEPVLEQLAGEFKSRVRFAKLDVDAHPDIADRYGIRSLPTLMLFRHGVLAGQATGYVQKHVLAEHLRAVAEAS